MKKKTLSILIIITMFISILLPTNQALGHVYASEQFNDIHQNWAKDQITDWINKGLINGYPDQTIRPNELISRAEFVALINRIFGYKELANEMFNDVSSSKWYYEDVLKAKKGGFISGYGDGTFRPEGNISRLEAVAIIYDLLKLNSRDDVNASANFKDSNQIQAWGLDYVNAVVAQGYIKGYEDQTFRPNQAMTRAEVITVLDRIIGNLIQAPGTYGNDDDKNVVNGNITINTEGVTLKNTHIKGDLYLAAGIGEGEVYLDNVTVEGRTIVSGGGENSIVFINSVINLILIDKATGRVRVLTQGETEVAKVVVKTGAILKEENKSKGIKEIEILVVNDDESIHLLGEFNKVLIKKNGIIEISENTIIDELETEEDASGAIINIEEGSIIATITLNAATKITGNGTLLLVHINTDGSSIEQKVGQYRLANNVTLVIIANNEIKENSDVEQSEPTSGDNNSDTSSPDDGHSQPDPQPDPQDPEDPQPDVAVQGAFIIEDKLYTVFNVSDDFSQMNWTINNTVIEQVYETQYESSDGPIGIFSINEGALIGSEYHAKLDEADELYDTIMLSTVTVTDEVYGYVYYKGTEEINFKMDKHYDVTDLEYQLPEEAVPLSDGDIITLFYGDKFILVADWNGIDGKWQFKNFINGANIEAPKNFSAKTISNTEIGLSWNEVSGADYYHVYYSDTVDGTYHPVKDELGDKKKITWQEGYSYIDDSNLPHSTRFYKVTAVYHSFESDNSQVASATTYYNVHIPLNFNVTAMIEHPSKPIMYITDQENKKLHAVNYETKDISNVSFDLPPESLAYENGELYVSLLKGEHSSYWFDNQQGSIAIVNAESLTVTSLIDIDIDPYDITADRNGYFYVASGSGQGTTMKSYSRSSLTEVASSDIRQKNLIQMHPIKNRIYTITTDLSPRDMRAYNVLNGNFVESPIPGGYDSPYHGDYPLTTNFKISPDGQYIFNGAGTVLYSGESKYDDMLYVYTLNRGFTDIAFNLINNVFYTAKDEQISVYDYENFEQTGLYHLDGIAKGLVNRADQLFALSDLNGKNILEIVEKDTLEIVPVEDDEGLKFDGRIADTVYDSKNAQLYVIDEAFRNLYIVDTDNQSIVKTIKLPYRPSGITLSEDGTKLYIVNDDEKYLVTEINLSDGSIGRHLSYTSLKDSGDSSHRHIYNNNGLLYVVMGDWEPKLLVFDAVSFAQVNYGTGIKGVGDLTFSSDNKFYYWNQVGWSAGIASSNVFAYSISGTTFSKIEQSNLEYPNKMNRDPLDTPILLVEDLNIIIAKNKVFDRNSLSTVIGEFPEPIYAVSPDGKKAVGKKGIYDIKTYQKEEALSLEAATEIFYDKNGTLFFIIGNMLYSK